MLRVSSGDEASTDEEDDMNDDSYDDSFIDDRTNPMAADTEDVPASVDMMAVYRFIPPFLSLCRQLVIDAVVKESMLLIRINDSPA